jgi:hypothetical protein
MRQTSVPKPAFVESFVGSFVAAFVESLLPSSVPALRAPYIRDSMAAIRSSNTFAGPHSSRETASFCTARSK